MIIAVHLFFNLFKLSKTLNNPITLVSQLNRGFKIDLETKD